MKLKESVCLKLFLLLAAMLPSLGSFAQAIQADSLPMFRPRYQPKPLLVKAVTKPDSAPSAPSMHINAQIQQLMDSVAEYNKNIEYAEGFRISVYTGNNRDLAMKAKELLYNQYPDFRVYLTYKLPTFKLKVGNYFSKFDAQRAMQKLKVDFPDALIVQDAILVR